MTALWPLWIRTRQETRDWDMGRAKQLVTPAAGTSEELCFHLEQGFLSDRNHWPQEVRKLKISPADGWYYNVQDRTWRTPTTGHGEPPQTMFLHKKPIAAIKVPSIFASEQVLVLPVVVPALLSSFASWTQVTEIFNYWTACTSPQYHTHGCSLPSCSWESFSTAPIL